MIQHKKTDASEGIDANKTSFLKMLDLNLKSMFVMDVMIY